MPITISILDAVAANVPRELLPAEFVACVDAIERGTNPEAEDIHDPNDKTPWNVAADWLDEYREPSLAAAFRYVAKRPAVTILKKTYYSDHKHWVFEGLPYAVSQQKSTANDDTLLGAVAGLAQKLEAARKELE